MKKPNALTAVAIALSASALGPTHADAAWSGWARCEIDIRGPGYTDNETHTWFVSNASPATPGSGSWSAAGGGSLDQGNPAQTSQHGAWSIGANVANGARYGVIVNPGTLEIRPLHAQLRQSNGINGYVQQTIGNAPRTPTPISVTEYEWGFPLVRGPSGHPTLTGASTSSPKIGWGPMQASGSVVTARCSWSLADGNVPPPPPPVTAPPAPTPPGRQPAPTPQPVPAGATPADPCAPGLQPRVTTQATSTLRGAAPSKDGEKIIACGQ